MNKLELITEVAKRLDNTNFKAKDVDKVLYTILDIIKTSVSNNEPVQLLGFGSFNQGFRKARIGRNPSSGSTLNIPACKSIKFKPSTVFKNQVNLK
jgi:DNA-binding protein HU-beta